MYFNNTNMTRLMLTIPKSTTETMLFYPVGSIQTEARITRIEEHQRGWNGYKEVYVDTGDTWNVVKGQTMLSTHGLWQRIITTACAVTIAPAPTTPTARNLA